MAVDVDEVLIVGVERDYDCLCLGEDKASKQKRLLVGKAKGKESVKRESGKRLVESSAVIEVIEHIATPKPKNDTNTSAPTSPIEAKNQNDEMQQPGSMRFHQPGVEVAGLVYAHPQPIGMGATPSNTAAMQSAAAPTGEHAFNGGMSSCGNQVPAVGAVPPGSSTSNGNLLGLELTFSDWDSILNKLPLTVDDQVAPTDTVNQCPRGTSSSSAALCGTSATPSGSNVSAAAPAVSSGAGFTNNFDMTEKDSAAHSTSHFIPAAPSMTNSVPPVITSNPNPPSCSNSFNLTNYPTSNAPPNPANQQNQSQNLTSFNPPSTAQSTAPAPTNHIPTSMTLNSLQPTNSFQAQHQQGYTINATASLPNQAPTPVPVQQPLPNGVQQQQGYPTVTPHSQPMNSNNTFFHPCPSSQLPPTQLQSSVAQQLSFNNTGGVSASNSQTFVNSQGFNNLVGGPARLQPLCNSHPSTGTEHLHNDENLARKLQEDEYIRGMRRSKHGDERLAMSLLASDLSIRQARHSLPDISMVRNNKQYLQQYPPPPAQMQTITGPSSTYANPKSATVLSNASTVLGGERQGQRPEGGNALKHPTCWGECPNCPSDATRKYHLIDVEQGSPEWNVVSQPLFDAGFNVTQLQRIQNETLWQRLCFEKQLMLRDRPGCNEKFLYHTSRAEVSVICEEGLDPRLSRNGLFGSGIYFSDNPIKCDKYWPTKNDSERTMFCCRVLLGDTKVYPNGKSEQLKREPPKENPQPGEPKTYDSVKGNISGQDEFVVYNAYRVMPEYVIKYYGSLEAVGPTPPAVRFGIVACRRRMAVARRLSAQFPYPNPHSMYHSPTPPPWICPHRTPAPFFSGPSNYYPMPPGPGAMGFGAPPIMPPQACYGVQPMHQSAMPYPPKST